MSSESNINDSPAENDAQLARLAEALRGFDVADVLARLNGNVALFIELLADLRQCLVAALPALRPSIQRGGIQEAQIRLHSLKGVCANLSAVELYQVFRNMEQDLATSGKMSHEMQISQMEQTIHDNLDAIGTLLEAETPPLPDSPPAGAPDKDLLIDAMNRLADLLDQGRLDAADGLMRLKSLLDGGHPHPEFNDLASAIRRLDYANARQALNVLAASMNIVL